MVKVSNPGVYQRITQPGQPETLVVVKEGPPGDKGDKGDPGPPGESAVEDIVDLCVLFENRLI